MVEIPTHAPFFRLRVLGKSACAPARPTMLLRRPRTAATTRAWRAAGVLIAPAQRAAHLTASELTQKNERNDFLRRVYRPYHEAPENGPERERLKFSGELFNAEWKVFRPPHACFV